MDSDVRVGMAVVAATTEGPASADRGHRAWESMID
jgi:hypothetical protein